MEKDKLNEILELHRKWLFNIEIGIKADLSSADLSSADLSSANLRSADLSYANLRSADLSSANLRSANLSYANLRSADLSYADLSYADLSYANLRSADLSYADLSSANLSYADLSYADLSYADLSYAKTDKRYIQIACVGSRKGMTTYCFNDDIIICGCFRGTLNEFKIKVLGSYPDSASKFYREYIGFINYLEGLK